jgi:cysteine desulfurase family protein (TIGR01976 family)
MLPTGFDPESIRHLFPSLQRSIAGRQAIFADAPGGTQVPRMVSTAMEQYLNRSNANSGGLFATSVETMEVVGQARSAAATILNADVQEIVFGQNMTSLTFSMSRALARTWKEGDEVVVTAMDHDANVAPWLLAAEDRGVRVRVIPFDQHGTISLTTLQAALTPRTRLVALGYASNAVGSLVDLPPLIQAAHTAGALVYIDAVHYAPHGLIDVRALNCDFLACSAYKFCGPHLGILYGKRSLLEGLTAYKVRPSTMVGPGKWETGTQNFEALAGLHACFEYLTSLGGPQSAEDSPRTQIIRAMHRVAAHERGLSQRFLTGLSALPGTTVYGYSQADQAGLRTPTFGITLANMTPHHACQQLANRGIFCWDGHFYAKGFVDQLQLANQGGVLRIGFAHYTTQNEVDEILKALHQLKP